ncbi:MAG: hypothetical protein H8D23_07855 [Candidatus Brocadiales bacterium]|nr:hypothetical protein [Candidatus Brocadiales bacterium]
MKATTKVVIKDNITKEETTVKDKDEYLPTAMKEGNPAYLNITAGMTKGLPNYSSAKISISITYPCMPEEINESYEKLKEWIDKRLIKEISELDS